VGEGAGEPSALAAQFILPTTPGKWALSVSHGPATASQPCVSLVQKCSVDLAKGNVTIARAAWGVNPAADITIGMLQYRANGSNDLAYDGLFVGVSSRPTESRRLFLQAEVGSMSASKSRQFPTDPPTAPSGFSYGGSVGYDIPIVWRLKLTPYASFNGLTSSVGSPSGSWVYVTWSTPHVKQFGIAGTIR
jgi:hypothetical protein